ncbi:signal recognition particle receptor subunit beta-like [Carcharodon carcharias]|uniref:signal recognition particle receptor subunit beta-like n=1 Tax=Carcharodon carcharias TaxID=13397 RepID=UPI001B7E2C32|nr:signal recognition particle receptor subunit beta-like [Carcharodon carcharias]
MVVVNAKKGVDSDIKANIVPLQLNDLPDHESLCLQYLEKHKGKAIAIVFVVDSVSLQKNVQDVAELLYMLLTVAMIVKNAPPCLIACNKQDMTMAKSAKLIQQQLEKELNTLKMIRSAAPKSLDGSGTGGVVPLGKKGKVFVECGARGSKGGKSEADLGTVEVWLVKVA